MPKNNQPIELEVRRPKDALKEIEKFLKTVPASAGVTGLFISTVHGEGFQFKFYWGDLSKKSRTFKVPPKYKFLDAKGKG